MPVDSSTAVPLREVNFNVTLNFRVPRIGSFIKCCLATTVLPVGVVAPATGAALHAAIRPHSGEDSIELGVLRHHLEGFCQGDVMLANALYCVYLPQNATTVAKGVVVLFKQSGSRINNIRHRQLLRTQNHIVSWPQPGHSLIDDA